MTQSQFEALQEGDLVWFYPDYFAWPWLATVRTIDGRKGVWVNFWGEGQCHFTPPSYRKDKWFNCITKVERQ